MAIATIRPQQIAEANNEAYLEVTQSEILEQRLVEGERHIAVAEAQGEDITRLVDFWIDLLHQYEHACREYLEEAA